MTYHVRDVLESVQDDPAPAPHTSTDDIIARAGRLRLRRTAALSGSAAGIVAVLVAGLSALQGANAGPDPSTPFAAGSPVGSQFTLPDGFSTVFGEYRTGKYKIGPVGQVATGYQELPVYLDGQTWTGDDGVTYPLVDGLITVYKPGVYNPDSLGTEDPSNAYGPKLPITVAGQPGIARETTPQVYASAGVQIGQSLAPQDVYHRTVLAWQYAPDAWATYIPQRDRDMSTAEAVRIASAVTAKPAQPLRVPYKLGFLPQGWQSVEVTQTPAELSTSISEVWLHKGPIPAADAAKRIDLGLPGVRITVMKGRPKDGSIVGKDGVHCYPDVKDCTIVDGAYLIDITGRDLDGKSSGITGAEVQQLAEGLQPGDLTDQSTWRTATK